MSRNRTFILSVAVCGGLTLLASSSASADSFGNRKRSKVTTLGKKTQLDRSKFKKLTEATVLSAEDYRKTKDKLKKLGAAKQGIIQTIIRRLEGQLQLADPDSRQYPEYLFRVALRYYAMRENQWSKAMEYTNKADDAEDAGKTALARKYRQWVSTWKGYAKQWLTKALKSYIKIVNNPKYRGYNRMHEVLFTVGDISKTLATEAEKAGRRAERDTYLRYMLTFFKRLTKEFPNSRYVPDALLAEGEYYFLTRNFTKAISIYQKVSRVRARLAPYANYKIGWCFINMRKWSDALSQFVGVVQGGKGGKTLIAAAQKDVVRAYSHIGQPGKAYNYFLSKVTRSPQISKSLFLLLGNMYFAQGKYQDTVKVFKEAWKDRWPRDPERCDWVTIIVDAAQNITANKGVQVKALAWLGEATRSLTKQLGAGAKQVKKCRDSTENTMKRFATQWHREAVKTGNVETMQRTKALYEQYLATYPKSPYFYLMKFQYADLVWVLFKKEPPAPQDAEKEWTKLAKTFDQIASMKKPANYKRYMCPRAGGKKKDPKCEDDPPFSERQKEAAFASMKAWIKATGLKESDVIRQSKPLGEVKTCKRQKVKGRYKRVCEFTYKQLPIPAKEAALIKAFDRYNELVPVSKFKPLITFNTGFIYWKYNHFAQAMKYYTVVATKHQTTMRKAALRAAWSVIDMLKVQKKYGQMRAYAARFLKDPELTKNIRFKTKLVQIQLKAMFAHASELMEKKKWLQCGTAFEEMAVSEQVGEHWPEQLHVFYYNSATCYEAAGMLGPAVRMRRALIRTFGKNRKLEKFTSEAMYNVAGNYHNLALFPKAAEWYEKYFKTYSKKKEAPQALMWGIVLRGGLGEEGNMQTNASKFIEKYGNSRREESAKAFWLMVKMFEEMGRHDKFMETLDIYLKRFARHGGADRALEASVLRGVEFWKQSCPKRMINGICMRIRYKRKKGRKKKQRVITYLARKYSHVKIARNFFRLALSKYWRNGAGLRTIPSKEAGAARRVFLARKFAAQAQFMLAEMNFEKYLNAQLPRLKFSNAAWVKRSVTKFKSWLAKKNKEGKNLVKAYAQVGLKIRHNKQADPHWTIASVARQGMIFHNFYDHLDNFPRPKEWGDEDWDKWRELLEGMINPLQGQAKKMYGLCLQTSGRLNWFNEWSRSCEREINRMDPENFPLAMEQRAQPGYSSTKFAQTNFITDVR